LEAITNRFSKDFHLRTQGNIRFRFGSLEDEGTINETVLRRYLDWLIERGVNGFYANGSTGEFPQFTPVERCLIFKVACEALISPSLALYLTLSIILSSLRTMSEMPAQLESF
jgi:dihydrodipicolinate synthase/N-acetylneuraminate lyase